MVFNWFKGLFCVFLGFGVTTIRAEAESTKLHGVSQKFFDAFGFFGDVVTKARTYNECMKKPEAVLAPMVLRMLVDFSGRVENLLKEIRLVFEYGS